MPLPRGGRVRVPVRNEDAAALAAATQLAAALFRCGPNDAGNGAAAINAGRHQAMPITMHNAAPALAGKPTAPGRRYAVLLCD